MHAEEADFSSSLDKRLREVAQDSRAVTPSADKAAASDNSEGPAEATDPSRDSFSDAGDEDIAKALASRIEGATSADEVSTDDNADGVIAAAPAEDEYLAGGNSFGEAQRGLPNKEAGWRQPCQCRRWQRERWVYPNRWPACSR